MNNYIYKSQGRVLYIMGAARSGSTALNTVLGNHDQIEAVGELGHLSRHGHVFEEYCACRQRADLCPFWSEVRRVWERYGGPKSITEYITLQKEFEGKKLRISQLLNERSNPSSRFQTYASQVSALFEAIRTVSGKNLIVDSTKTPLRALSLSTNPDIDLKVVHLIRDGRGVAWSMKKGLRKDNHGGVQKDQAPRNVLRTAVYWMVMNLQSEWVRRQLSPRVLIRVRYEDFMAQPKVTLRRIGILLECDLSDIAKAIDAEKMFSVGHTIAGNRLRMKGVMRLQPDLNWTQQMPIADRVIFKVAAGLLLLHYGYN